MKKAFRFFPVLIVFYLPFHFYGNVNPPDLPASIAIKNTASIELSGYIDETNSEAILYWSANKCTAEGYFVVERKEDSAAYHKIDQIECAQNNDLIGNYEYVDTGDVSKFSKLKYRISYQEPVRAATYSNELQLSPKGASGFKNVHLYPNPAANDFTIEFSSLMDGGEVIVYDLLGAEIARKPFNNRQEKLFFDCSAWAVGIYNIVIYAGDDNLQMRLSVRRMQI